MSAFARASTADRHLQWLVQQARTRVDSAFPERAAVVLLGSLARGEGTVLVRGSRALVLSDLDLAVVFRTSAERDRALPRVVELARGIGRAMRPWGLLGAVDLGAYARADWDRLEPRPGTLELTRSAQVVSGDARVLEGLPAIDPADIGREEALLLCENRLLELLWAHAALARGMPRAFAAAYAGGKAVLDGGLAFLLGRHECPGTAEERLAAVERIIAGAPDPSAGGEFLESLLFWTAFKHAPEEDTLFARYAADPLESCRRAWLEGGVMLLAVYRYLLEEQAALPGSAVRAWRFAQSRAPLKRRFRRWLEAWRARGGRELDWARARRIVAGALGGTPEHRMGAAAAALVACAPGMNGDPADRARAERFARAASPMPWPRRAAWETRRDLLVRGWDRWVLRGTRSGPKDAPWDDH